MKHPIRSAGCDRFISRKEESTHCRRMSSWEDTDAFPFFWYCTEMEVGCGRIGSQKVFTMKYEIVSSMYRKKTSKSVSHDTFPRQDTKRTDRHEGSKR